MATPSDLLSSRIPPHSLEAERAVLGAVLDDGADALATAQLTPEDFYKQGHRQLMTILVEMSVDDIAIDIVTVTEQCRERSILEEIGGTAMLAGLQAEAGLLSHVAEYARTLKDARARRDAIRLATEIIGTAFEAQESVGTLLEARRSSWASRSSSRPPRRAS